MSGSSYRLEASRARPPPPPLRFQNSSHKSTTILNSNEGSQTLLYDLPTAPSLSPPPSSPKYSARAANSGGRGRGARSGKPTPPPSARNRSTTPIGIAPTELERFAENCRAWYFEQNEDAGRLMTQTLTTLAPSQRAPFSRLQASIRSAFHASNNARRNAAFQAHIGPMQPGGSLMPHSRADPNGPLAKKERYDRLDRFVRSWCTVGMPGTKPFFEGLWAVFRLQVIPEHLGGSGPRRIEWEIDDAVFKEAAGKDFMLEAIEIMKGVLAFEEVVSSKRASTSNLVNASSYAHLRSQSQPLPSHLPRAQPPPMSDPIETKRPRAPSDPFSDTPGLSHSIPTSSSQSSSNHNALITSFVGDDDDPSPPLSPAGDGNKFTGRSENIYIDAEQEYMRIWTTPDLTNPELISLLDIFPTFISRRTLPRFTVESTVQNIADLEEGEDEPTDRKEVHCGTGTMWLSPKIRSDGWNGGWWTRFLIWWKKTFPFC